MNENPIVVVRVGENVDRPVVYVGRPTPLGNRWKVEDVGRTCAVETYREWLHAGLDPDYPEHRHVDGVRRQLNLIWKLAQLPRGVALSCWCAPEPCHADVIAQIVRARLPRIPSTDWEEVMEAEAIEAVRKAG